MQTPHLYTGDHADIFVTPVPAGAERPYGPADTHFSVDLSGNVELHFQNPRHRGEEPEWRSRRSAVSRAAVVRTEKGYVIEMALSHDDTWVNPREGAIVACSMVVTDHGDRQMMLRQARLQGYLSVQPAWPCIELAP
jgi:hypothetical protein